MVADATSCNAPVRFYRGNQKNFFHGGNIPEQLITGCVRIRQYLWNAFAQNAEYIIWNKRAFSKRSYEWINGRQPRGYTVEYVEKLMRTFRKMTTEFRIEVIHYRGHPRLKVTPLHGTPGDKMQEIRRRLARYIQNSVRAGRTVRVDAAFLNRFIKTTGQPAELVVAVWLRLKYIQGCQIRWRGVGGNLRCEVSLQQSSLPHSSPTGRRFIQTGPMAPKLSTGASPPRVGRLHTGGSPPNGTAVTQLSQVAPSERRPQRWQASDESKAAEALEGWTAAAVVRRIAAMNVAEAATIDAGASLAPGAARGASPANDHGPFQVHGRWFSGKKFLCYASWLADNPMRAEHEWQPNVEFIAGYARNFAERALRAGHHRDAVLAAYAYGVQHANKDALDKHVKAPVRRDDNGEWRAPEQRKPSSAIAYAWGQLRRDSRTREERWAAMLAGERPAKLPAIARYKADPVARPKRKRNLRPITPGEIDQVNSAVPDFGVSKIVPRDRAKFQTLKEIFSPQENRALELEQDGPPLTLGELQRAIEPMGFTLAQFNQMHWQLKKRIVQNALAQRRKPGA